MSYRTCDPVRLRLERDAANRCIQCGTDIDDDSTAYETLDGMVCDYCIGDYRDGKYTYERGKAFADEHEDEFLIDYLWEGMSHTQQLAVMREYMDRLPDKIAQKYVKEFCFDNDEFIEQLIEEAE